MDPAMGGNVTRLSDLRGKKVRSITGDTLGRVHEVHCEGERIAALVCGPGSFMERWTARGQGREIPLQALRRIGDDEILVDLGGP
jgi:sporulation protein YlmC with PRC-barrel domain